VVFPHPDLQLGLDRLFQLAQERHLDLDLHVDESSNPADHVLGKVATAKLRHNFTGQVVCGHCCTLALQPPEMMAQTIAQVKAAQIAIVSLPLCNLYLQDRQADRTPRWRGVTALHELNQAQVPVVLASDNCRDPFYGFGDHDGLEVFRESVRIAHLDRPYSQWPQAVTRTPAQLMASAEGTMAGSKMTGEMIGRGIIGEGVAADFIVFAGRGFSELLSRCQHDRWVIRRGRAIATTLPDYSDLDRYMT
jgi:cytosine deaminase